MKAKEARFELQPMTLKHTRELDIFYNEHRYKCTHCNKLFSDGDCAHLGYLHDDSYAVLCDECSVQLKETVVRYHWQKDIYEIPKSTDKLWHYMDLSKFISLISKKELYFSAATCFDDPFEGAKGVVSMKQQWDEFYLDFFKQAILTAPGMDLSKLTPEKLDSKSQRLLDEINSTGKIKRQSTFISCWHLNDFESEAMWKLYSKDVTNAFAIQTTYLHLYEALGKEPYISIGKVNYIDFSKQFTSVNDAFWFKRKSFEHEHEVRAIVKRRIKDKQGISIPIDIHKLIENIYISPYAPIWFSEVVKSIMEKYDINTPLLQSDMCSIPFY